VGFCKHQHPNPVQDRVEYVYHLFAHELTINC